MIDVLNSFLLHNWSLNCVIKSSFSSNGFMNTYITSWKYFLYSKFYFGKMVKGTPESTTVKHDYISKDMKE